MSEELPTAITTSSQERLDLQDLVQRLENQKRSIYSGVTEDGQPLFLSHDASLAVLGGTKQERADRALVQTITSFPGPVVVISSDPLLRDRTEQARRALAKGANAQALELDFTGRYRPHGHAVHYRASGQLHLPELTPEMLHDLGQQRSTLWVMVPEDGSAQDDVKALLGDIHQISAARRTDPLSAVRTLRQLVVIDQAERVAPFPAVATALDSKGANNEQYVVGIEDYERALDVWSLQSQSFMPENMAGRAILLPGLKAPKLLEAAFEMNRGFCRATGWSYEEGDLGAPPSGWAFVHSSSRPVGGYFAKLPPIDESPFWQHTLPAHQLGLDGHGLSIAPQTHRAIVPGVGSF